MGVIVSRLDLFDDQLEALEELVAQKGSGYKVLNQ